MLGNTVGYAAKKRKKPVQKIPKPQPAEGIKSNPSKRHRDRLNNELDRLAALLPFPDEVRSRLDKLSVLRLGVGYLKVKSFFNATLQRNDASWLADRTVALGGNGKSTSSIDGVAISEGDLLLQALNGFVLVVTAEGYVFYASSTVQDYLGFHQSDVVHQSVFEMIHTDDRPMFRRQLHFALNPNQGDSEQETSAQQTSSQISSNIVTYDPQLIPPENSSFLERSFCCRFRCLLDNSSGFLALNFRGRLKYLHGQNQVLSDGTAAHSQLALFAIATPVQTPAILEIRTKTLIFQTKHKLDFSPLGIDTRGKVVLGYSEMELCMKGSGYHFIHAADMMYCADNHMRMIKTGESGFTVFRLLSKSGVWLWVQANARLVFKGGRPDFIVARQRPLTNEEGEENFRKRRLQLPFNCATGKGLLYDTGPNLDMLDPTVPRSANSSEAQALDPKSLLGSMLKQDHSVYIQPPPPDHQLTVDQAFMDSHALLSVPGDSWQQAVPQPSKGPKQDPMVAGIMDSLEQIMGDSTLGAALEELEVKDGELKEWENTLLKMNVGGNNVSMELDGILANDIFSYVEEALFGESASAGSHPVDGNSGSRGLSIPPGCFAQDAALLGERSSQGARIRDYGLPGDDQQGTLIPAMLGGQVQAVPQVDFGGMGEQIHLGGMGRGGGMQEVMRSDPRASIRLNEPTLAQNDGLLSLPQPGLSAQACRSGHNNPMPFSPGLAVPHTQSPVSRGLSVSQTTPGFGSRPQKTLQSAPSTAVGPVQQDLLALSIQNQNQHQLQQQQGIMRKQYERQKRQIFASQSNHAILDSPQDQWNPSIPKCNFEDNLQDVCSPHLPSEYGLSKPSPAQHLRGHFSVETHDLPSEPPHSWQQQQEVLTTACNGFPPTSSNLQNSYGQDCLRDPPLGSLPQISQNWGTAYSYGTQNPMPVPSSSNMNNFMFSNGPQPLENGLCLGGLELGGSVPPYQKLNPLNGQISQQANCGFQNLPGNVLLGPSASSSQGNGLPFSVGPGLPREDAPAQQQFLNCNGQPQIPGHPSEENQPFPFPPVSNGTVYFSENNQTNCCDF